MAKGKSTSVRFNIEQLEFAKTREGFKSAQQLIDFFLADYWFKNRGQKVKVVEPETNSTPQNPFRDSVTKEIVDISDMPLKPRKLSNEETRVLNEALIKSQSKHPTSFEPAPPPQKSDLEKQIEAVEEELEDPPKNPMLGISVWKRMKKMELKQLQDKLKNETK